jgi:hypothetical protein
MVVKIQVIFWVVMPYSVVVEYQCYRGPSGQEAARSPKTVVSYCNTTWCHNPEDFNSILLNSYVIITHYIISAVVNCY